MCLLGQLGAAKAARTGRLADMFDATDASMEGDSVSSAIAAACRQERETSELRLSLSATRAA